MNNISIPLAENSYCNIAFRESKKSLSIIEQRESCRTLLSHLLSTTPKINYLSTGRPFVEDKYQVDISFSHKDIIQLVGLTSKPNQIGVDVELRNSQINVELFEKNVVLGTDQVWIEKKYPYLKKSDQIILLWSLKESVFKCLNRPLLFKTIRIKNIDLFLTWEKNSSLSKENTDDEILTELKTYIYIYDYFMITATIR